MWLKQSLVITRSRLHQIPAAPAADPASVSDTAPTAHSAAGIAQPDCTVDQAIGTREAAATFRDEMTAAPATVDAVEAPAACTNEADIYFDVAEALASTENADEPCGPEAAVPATSTAAAPVSDGRNGDAIPSPSSSSAAAECIAVECGMRAKKAPRSQQAPWTGLTHVHEEARPSVLEEPEHIGAAADLLYFYTVL